MYYASFGILSLVLHLIIHIELLMKRVRKSSLPLAILRYRQFLIGVMFYYVADILWGLLYENALLIPAYADTILYFVSMVVSVLLWTRYVVAYLNRKNVFDIILTYAGWLIFLFVILSLIVNFFTPVFFRFEKDGEYIPGYARHINLYIQVALFVLTAVYSLINAIRTEGKIKLHYVTIAVSGFVMTLFIIFQEKYPLLPFYAIGCLIATCIVHTYITRDERDEYIRELGGAKEMAYTDSLTGVKSMHAYVEAKENLNNRISEGSVERFGIIVFDMNDLKSINDNLGHEEGDRSIQAACKAICRQFKHSPVFRIGGDEFVTILEGEDYNDRKLLLYEFDRQIDENTRDGKIVIASGLGEYDPATDNSFDRVFARADRNMYDRKKALKEV